MRNMKKIIAMLMLCMLLGSCGLQQPSEHSIDKLREGESVTASEQVLNVVSGQKEPMEEVKWILEETTLPDADAALKNLLPEGGSCLERICTMVEDTIYRVVILRDKDLESRGICIQTMNSPYTEWENYPIYREEWVEGQYCYATEVAVQQDGSVHILLQGTGNKFYMAEWTKNTGCAVRDISDVFLTDEFLTGVTGFYVDAENTTYFVSNESVQYFDETFSEREEWKDSGYVWQIIESDFTDGKIYLCGCVPDGRIRIWSLDGKEPVFLSDDVSMYWSGKITFIDATEGYLCNPDVIWQFSTQNGQIDSLMSFNEHGYSIEKICSAAVGEKGTLRMLALVEGELVLLERVEDIRWQEKVKLELATWYASPFLREAIVDFNKQNKDYYIELRVPEEGEIGMDFAARVLAELNSGGGPALLCGEMIDWKVAADKGYLRNLTKDFAVLKEGVLDNVIDACEIDGECYVIPHSFAVNTLVTSADIAEEKAYWTSAELIQGVKESGAEAAITMVDSPGLFSLMAVYELVDWENGKSYLNSAEAIALLEFAGVHGDMGSYQDSGIRIAERKILAEGITVSGLNLPAIMGDLFLGREAYVGYPVQDGGNGHILYADGFAINQSCEHPEGAIAFLEYLLTYEMQNKLAKVASKSDSSRLPVSVEAFNRMFDYAKETEMDFNTQGLLSSYGGYNYVEEPISKESLEKVRHLLLSAEPETEDTSTVRSIMMEETPAYFSGTKSAQEVCKIMHNRVQLFLDER